MARSESNTVTSLGRMIGLVPWIFLIWVVYLGYDQDQFDQRFHVMESNIENAIVFCEALPEQGSDASCLAEFIDAEAEKKARTYDLVAQQDMAKWAFVLMLMTGVGIYFLRETLVETRKVTLETRRIGEAQTRGYFSVIKAEYELPENTEITATTDPHRKQKIIITVQNSGQSPGRKIACELSLDVYCTERADKPGYVLG